MDVLVGFAATLANDSTSEPLVELLEYLGSRRTRAAAKFRRTISDYRRELRRGLKRCAKVIGKDLDASQGRADGDPSRSTNAMARALTVEAELGAWPKLNERNIHPFRLKVKELRYTLQLARDSDSGLIRALGEVKDEIGKWHDWKELATVANHVLGHGCETTDRIEQRVKEQLDNALSSANSLRAKYLKAKSSQGAAKKRPRLQLETSALKATSRLAA